MVKNTNEIIAKNLNIPITKVNEVMKLLGEGNTVPFIARYRKEQTGGLDEEVIFAIQKDYEYVKNLLERKEQVIRLIDEKGLLTDELVVKINACDKLVDVEDIYLPFKEKKHTLASIAIKNGLEELANKLKTQVDFDLNLEANKYINENVATKELAITGALHIISEEISDNADYRKFIRNFTFNTGSLESTVKKNAKDEKKVYEIYYDFSTKIKDIKHYRTLAINRGEKEKVLTVKVKIDKEYIISYLKGEYITNKNVSYYDYLVSAIEDSFARLIYPSVEREVRAEISSNADESAIKVFSKNLEQLLMQPPLKGKRVLGVDPAFRTGCKLSVVNEFGDLEYTSKVFVDGSFDNIAKIVKDYNINLIAIGNGTASRETEFKISEVIKNHGLDIHYIIVNEAGASVYSASKIARDEFPDLAVEERSAVSIARRIQDPLAELVKIDSKSIGVGQYQHDVNQKSLANELDFVVQKVVNNVGIDLNAASETILCHISGITPRIAKSIINYRRENGKFVSRKQLLDVKFLGDKCFVQSAGFLRILDGDNKLDETGIHPESYELCGLILSDLGVSYSDIGSEDFNAKISALDVNLYASKFNSDKYTIDLIKNALLKPRRDPRDDKDTPVLRSDVLTIEDLNVGMEVEGQIINIVDFGAFVDIGIKNSALLHISKISKTFIKHPLDILNVGQIVKAKVIDVDITKGKVAISML